MNVTVVPYGISLRVHVYGLMLVALSTVNTIFESYEFVILNPAGSASTPEKDFVTVRLPFI